jgi:DNA polymerase-3 subunit delta
MQHKNSAPKRTEGERIAPLYVVYGTDEYRIEQWQHDLQQRWIVQYGGVGSAVHRYDVDVVPMSSVLEQLHTSSFFATQKLMFLKRANFLTTLKHRVQEKEVEQLMKYIDHPDPQTVLVFIAHVAKLDERKKIVKFVKRQAVECVMTPWTGHPLRQWMRTLAAEEGVKIDAEAIETLLQCTGEHSAIIAQEIRKMATYVGTGQTITALVVSQLAVPMVEDRIFSFVDAVIERQVALAFRGLEELFLRKEEPVKILFLLARQFRMVASYKSSEHFPSIIPPPFSPMVVKKMKRQGLLYTEQTLEKILVQLADVDMAMKTGGTDPKRGLEQFLWWLTVCASTGHPHPVSPQ